MRGVIVGGVVVLASLALLLAACGQTGASVSPTATTPPPPTFPPTPTPAGNTITMAGQHFTPTALAIKAGQAVTFTYTNPDSGPHPLVTGKTGKYIAEPGAPPELNTPDGLWFNEGDPPKAITFPTAGTFDITCTAHPAMQLTITVSA